MNIAFIYGSCHWRTYQWFASLLVSVIKLNVTEKKMPLIKPYVCIEAQLLSPSIHRALFLMPMIISLSSLIWLARTHRTCTDQMWIYTISKLAPPRSLDDDGLMTLRCKCNNGISMGKPLIRGGCIWQRSRWFQFLLRNISFGESLLDCLASSRWLDSDLEG